MSAGRNQRQRARRRGYDWHDEQPGTDWHELALQLLATQTSDALHQLLDAPLSGTQGNAEYRADADEIVAEYLGGRRYPDPFTRR